MSVRCPTTATATSMILGRKHVAEHFGDKVETTYVENVAEGPDTERVIQQLAQGGHGLIFTTSFGFMNPTLKVAQRFPKVKFEHATGYKRAPMSPPIRAASMKGGPSAA